MQLQTEQYKVVGVAAFMLMLMATTSRIPAAYGRAHRDVIVVAVYQQNHIPMQTVHSLFNNTNILYERGYIYLLECAETHISRTIDMKTGQSTTVRRTHEKQIHFFLQLCKFGFDDASEAGEHRRRAEILICLSGFIGSSGLLGAVRGGVGVRESERRSKRYTPGPSSFVSTTGRDKERKRYKFTSSWVWKSNKTRVGCREEMNNSTPTLAANYVDAIINKRNYRWGKRQTRLNKWEAAVINNVFRLALKAFSRIVHLTHQ